MDHVGLKARSLEEPYLLQRDGDLKPCSTMLYFKTRKAQPHERLQGQHGPLVCDVFLSFLIKSHELFWIQFVISKCFQLNHSKILPILTLYYKFQVERSWRIGVLTKICRTSSFSLVYHKVFYPVKGRNYYLTKVYHLLSFSIRSRSKLVYSLLLGMKKVTRRYHDGQVKMCYNSKSVFCQG